jgi:hypothetical protein
MNDSTLSTPTTGRKVRPGRVDDLALAIAGRIVERHGNPMVKEIFHDLEPVLEPLAKEYLGKLRIPGVPRTRRAGVKKVRA